MLGLIFIITCIAWTNSEIFPAPRGVPINKKPLYDQSGKSHFQCLDNSMTISFDWVNDDYCDCKDGSDEPGTSACGNGRFYCLNLGHKPLEVQSSRVNDQICDCCDGSDEWSGLVKCFNYCDEAGKTARIENERLQDVQREGYEKRKDLVKAGREKKVENKKTLEQMNSEKEQFTIQLEELDMVKQVAEKSEKEAKDLHTDRCRGEIDAKNAVEQSQKAEAAFVDLDVNSDKKITFEEVQYRMEFDRDLDGKVTQEEITEYFAGKPETEFEHFVDEVWSNIKHIYRPMIPAVNVTHSTASMPSGPHDLQVPPTTQPVERISDEFGEESEPEDEIKGDEVDDFDGKSDPPNSTFSEIEEDKMPDFDENTQKLIADADQARREYTDVESKMKDLEKNIKNIEEYSQLDLGPADEYAQMHRQCFEWHDPQYTYGLCLFDRTYQNPKSGHGDVNLGTWGSWKEVNGEKYTQQIYKDGQACWNGPARSTVVTLLCGSENKLLSAYEPAKCEYAMDFQTPAACNQPSLPHDGHSEL